MNPEHPSVFIGYELRHPAAKVPTYAHPGDAGADLYAVDFEALLWHYYCTLPWILQSDEVGLHTKAVLRPGEVLLIHTHLAVAIPEGWEATVRPRSGLAFKHGVTMFHPIGTIDQRWRGELDVMLINHSGKDFELKRGDRVAQIVFTPVGRAIFTQGVDDGKGRGTEGYGSSGGFGGAKPCLEVQLGKSDICIFIPESDKDHPCKKLALGQDAQGTWICEEHARDLLDAQEPEILGRVMTEVLKRIDQQHSEDCQADRAPDCVPPPGPCNCRLSQVKS